MERDTRPATSPETYEVGVITLELAAVRAMIDEIRGDERSTSNGITYCLGRIGRLNVVIASPPEPGMGPAARTGRQLMEDFRFITIALLVGIGGGVPGENIDIRIRDIAVSFPNGPYNGVIEYLKGKVHPNGRFENTGASNKPSDIALSTVKILQDKHDQERSKTPLYMAEMLHKYLHVKENGYMYQGEHNDLLFQADYNTTSGIECVQPDHAHSVNSRPRREDTDPRIHYGTIGSGARIIKDGVYREELRKRLGIVSVEIEAVELMHDFKPLVIRGISDYADSHKNDVWQRYAAATAAAYMKELLLAIPKEIERNKVASAVST